MVGLLWLLVAASLQSSEAFSAGPPTSVCPTLLPNHPGNQPPGNGGFLISTNIPTNADGTGYQYSPGLTYTVTLTGTTTTFRGFAVQSVSIVDESPLGAFSPAANQQLLACPLASDYTIIHNNPTLMDFSSQSLMWRAPSTAGVVNFLYTVVERRPGNFYVRRSAIAENVPSNVIDGATQSSVDTTQPPVDTNATQPLPAGVTIPSTDADSLPLKFQIPEGCSASECDVYVGIERNSGNQEYLNFYLEGEASAWVAVGFSKTPTMFSADVLGCAATSTGDVVVLDTWNIGEPSRYNILDEMMDFFTISTSMTDGRIRCSFVRSISGTGTDQDYSLDEDYYVLYGRSSGRTGGRLNQHRTAGGANLNPTVSANLVNPASDTGSQAGSNFDTIKRILIQTHGILMLFAWGVLAPIAIFFASYMRPALPNGEWFQVHRAFMIISLFMAALGFVLIFVSQLRSPTPGLIDLGTGTATQRTKTAHFSIGIIVMFLQIVNPIIAIFRCHPGTKNRRIFNVVHGFPGIGIIAEILALSNIGIGLSLFSNEFSRFGNLTIFWVHLAYVIFITLLHFAINIILSVIKKKIKKTDRLKVEMKEDKAKIKEDKEQDEKEQDEKEQDEENEENEGEEEEKKKRKEPSADSPFRWMGIAIFTMVTVLVAVILLVLIALPLS